jgi:hypothetical protein
MRKASEGSRQLGGADYTQMPWYGFGGGLRSRIGCIVSYRIAKVAIFSYAADSGVFRDSSDVSGVIGTVIASV